MRSLQDKILDTRDMIKYIGKECRKCLKGGAKCSGDVCRTYNQEKDFKEELERQLQEQGGVN